MNIIIPIGGVGKRFKDEGFSSPKPLINVLGVPMIFKVLESLKLDKEDKVHIVYNSELKSYNFESLLIREFHNLNFNFVSLKNSTKGAAETVLFGLQNIDESDLQKEFLILDCDTFYSEDIISKYKSSDNKNSIFYFNDTDNKPIFSYVILDESNCVILIKEKEKISDNANSGAYGFESGILLKRFCEKIIDSKTELYISMIYERMILDGEKIKGIPIKDFFCVGTPLQLKVYCENNMPSNKIRVCFDLDNTLVTFPKIKNDYSSVEPIEKNIEYLRFLKEQGNYIIIYTARRMKTHNGNVGKIIPDISEVTIETLRKFKIPYDELHFGKPWANFYVDDLAVSAFSSLDKAIGFYDTRIDPRDFNKIEYDKDKVTKKTNNPGEIFFYNNTPENVSYFFPSIFSAENNEIVMERIKGVTFSHLYVNCALSSSNIKDLIDSLKIIHSSKIPPIDDKPDIYSNYSRKTKSRFIENYENYSSIKDSESIFNLIIEKLEEYEKKDLGRIGVIHGDPVFTNVFLTERGLKFIDPRGSLSGNFSIFGDVYYDYAKVFQSIMGYDNVLHGIEINYDYRDRMADDFFSNFSEKEVSYIKILTASLLLSLIPLHSIDEERKIKYFDIIKELIKK
jgi:capsule biosynthesis phosphatase